MNAQANWQNEPRDERGRWTSGGGSIVDVSDTSPPGDAVDAALAGLPMAARDRLNAIVSGFDRDFRGNVAGTLPGGRADGARVLADTLNQLSINGKGSFGDASRNMIAELRGIVTGLQPGQSAEVRGVAAEQLRDLLSRRDKADSLAQAMHDVERNKMANVGELARILENEAGSDKDHPIMEAVGHTVLNRMQRNETASVTDVSGRYTRGRRPASNDARELATRLLNGELPDKTGGATHFYQPYPMALPPGVPMGHNRQYETGNPPTGYEYVPGVTVKDKNGGDVPAFSVRPGWADDMQQVTVKGIPDSLAKFFIAPGSRHVR